jgi:uncharacterized protein (DUF4415 family)
MPILRPGQTETPAVGYLVTSLPLAKRKNRRNPAPVVALRLMPDVLAKYKALGKGYTGIMADVLNYVADNPEILSKVH